MWSLLGKRPRVTLSPSLAMKDGKPFLASAVQGGDTQDQNLLQFFLNVAEFGMNVQQASEAANINTNQLWLSLGGTKLTDREPKPGQILLHDSTPEAVRLDLKKMGYTLVLMTGPAGPSMEFTLTGSMAAFGEDQAIMVRIMGLAGRFLPSVR